MPTDDRAARLAAIRATFAENPPERWQTARFLLAEVDRLEMLQRATIATIAEDRAKWDAAWSAAEEREARLREALGAAREALEGDIGVTCSCAVTGGVPCIYCRIGALLDAPAKDGG